MIATPAPTATTISVTEVNATEQARRIDEAIAHRLIQSGAGTVLFPGTPTSTLMLHILAAFRERSELPLEVTWC